MIWLYLLSAFYGIMFLVYLIYTIKDVLEKKQFKIIDFVRFMYTFVYGFFPMILFFRESQGERNLYFYDYSSSGIENLYILCFFSIVIFILMNLSYNTVRNREIRLKYNETDKSYSIFFVCGVGCLLIGFAGIVLWSSAYGSIDDFILQANLIRSGRSRIYNPLAFMQHFAHLVEVALFVFVALWTKDKEKGLVKRFIYILFLLLSAYGCYIFLLMTDSRIQITFVCLGILMIVKRSFSNIKRALLLFGVIMFIVLLLTMSADTFTSYVRYGDWVVTDENFLDSLIKEFRFTQSSQMMVLRLWFNKTLEFKFLDDLILTATSWIPSRFIPFELPLNIWHYNTLNVSGILGRGTTPSDLLASSIYEFGILGVIVNPIIFGFLIALADNTISFATLQEDVYGAVFVGMFMHKVSHFSYESFMWSLFPLFMFFILYYTIYTIVKSFFHMER